MKKEAVFATKKLYMHQWNMENPRFIPRCTGRTKAVSRCMLFFDASYFVYGIHGEKHWHVCADYD
jgi:hypothetical protein